MSSSTGGLVFGSRGSALARWQTARVIDQLRAAHPALDCRVEYFSTSGDRIGDVALPEFGSKGVFTDDLARALLSGRIDAAVHSLKDLPVEESPGLALGAIDRRADARDVLVSAHASTLESLPQGARVGTCSLRRSAQLLAARPDVQPLPIRGNVDTRVRKAMDGEYDAIILAAAGVLRLGLGTHISEYLPFEVMLPAPGQGAIAVQQRAGDERVAAYLRAVDHQPTRDEVTAERAFLESLGGGCSAPIAAYATSGAEGGMRLTGAVASLDGSRIVRVSAEGTDPRELGAQAAGRALSLGAGVLLP